MNKYMITDNKLWEKVNEDFGPNPGIYRVHILNANGSFERINRMLDNDNEGIIYIGTSAKLSDRISTLKKSICAAYWQFNPNLYSNISYRDPYCHQVGKKLIQIPDFFNKYHLENICLTLDLYKANSNNENVVDYGYYLLEEKLLNDYRLRFGERPFLNN